MGIIKTTAQQLQDARRENEALKAALAQEREKVAFLALLTADIDLDELMEEDDDAL